MPRGPEYADNLTGAERRTLDALVAEAGRRLEAPNRHRPPRRAWLVPLATGLAVLVLLVAVAGVDRIGREPAPPVPAASEPVGAPSDTQAAPSDTLAALAAATVAVADPLAPLEQWYVRRLHVIVTITDGTDRCLITEMTSRVWVNVDLPERQPTKGRLVAEATTWRGTGSARAARCTKDAVERRYERFDQDGVVAQSWEEFAAGLAGTAPRYTDPLVLATIGPPVGIAAEEIVDHLARLADPPSESDHAGAWWVGLGRLLASPQTDATLRAAALRAAAIRDDVVAVPEVATDYAGRPGVTLRVPYAVDGDDTTAEFTFDRDTGALLQQLVHTGTGAEITVH